MSEVLASGALDRLDPADRARAQRLAVETLRGLERADRILSKHLQKTPALTVHNALRVGTVELCQGAAAPRRRQCVRAVGVRTQAVWKTQRAGQRGVAQSGHARPGRMGCPARAPLAQMAARTFGPGMGHGSDGRDGASPFRGRPFGFELSGGRRGTLGQDAWRRCVADGVRAGWLMQVKFLRWKGTQRAHGGSKTPPPRSLPKCSRRKKESALLDLCAAPGGKTMQMSAMGAEVTAVDLSKGRMARVEENLGRTGLNAEVLVQDALTLEGEWDAILLDAPCSATGTIRRHPDLPHAKDGSEFGDLIALQAQMLDHAVRLLKSGGRLVFCTCSLLPDEGEVQIEDALERHPALSIDPTAALPAGVDPAWRTSEGGVRLRPDFWPELGGMDGFYIAVLHKA